MVTRQLNNLHQPVVCTVAGSEDFVSDTQTLIENRPSSVAVLFLERVAATPDAEAYRYPVTAASGQGPDPGFGFHWNSGGGPASATSTLSRHGATAIGAGGRGTAG